MRALLVVLVLVLAPAAPAAAQQPIAGGGSFNDAPVLKPGRYSDTLRGDEQLFYAVDLKRGQKVSAAATVSGRTDANYTMRLQIYNSLRDDDTFDGEDSTSWSSSDNSVSLRVTGQRVGEDDGGINDDVYAEPGPYYIGLTADDAASNLDPVQFEAELDIQVTGEIIEEAPTPSPAPAGAQATPAPGSGSTAGLGAGAVGANAGGGELGLAIVLGLSLGGLIGFGARRLRAG